MLAPVSDLRSLGVAGLRTLSGRALLLVMGLCALAACRKPTGTTGTGSFDDVRLFLQERVHPVAARWQGAERRAAALEEAGQAAAAAIAAKEASGLALRWADLLEEAPTPLPLRAPFARQRKVLRALAGSTGAARGKQLDELLRLLEDLSTRKVVPAPPPGEPLSAGAPLLRLWRDVSGLKPPEDGTPGAQPDTAALLGELAAVLQGSSPQQPGDAPALEAAAEMLLIGQAYLNDPPSLDMETARALRTGAAGEEVLERAVCRSLAPLRPRLLALQTRAAEVATACGGPRRCSSEAAAVVHHPVMRQLDELRTRAVRCAAPPAPGAAPAAPPR